MNALIAREDRALTTTDIMTAFGAFLRLHVADGDASPETLRSYYGNAAQFVAWCAERSLDPTTVTENDIKVYRQDLVSRYEVGTVAVKLAAIRRLYEAAVWRGLRQDNPVAGLKAPKDRTERSERVKYLPLDGLRRLLAAPVGDGPAAVRDRAMLSLMGRHGLRVSEVADLMVDDVDFEASTIKVLGKGKKSRTIYLTETTAATLRQWLAVRVASPGESALFIALDRAHGGKGMTARAIRYLVDSYLAGLGLKGEGVSCHSLRHSAATWARAGGAKLDAISGMLGHANIQTTTVYSKIVDRMQENPAKFLETMLEAQASH